jgi:electron transport complex protein RnfE
MALLKVFTNGLWNELPPFRLVLGLCPTLAVTKGAKTGLGMGLAVIFVLTCSNVLVSAIRKIIPRKVRLASFIVIIATFVVIVELLSQAFFYSIYEALGIFIPLIVVNCIILGRAEAFASRNGVLASALDGLGIGLGYTLSLILLGGIREVLGQGTLFGAEVMWASFRPFSFMVEAPGAFVSLGILLAIMNVFSKQS